MFIFINTARDNASERVSKRNIYRIAKLQLENIYFSTWLSDNELSIRALVSKLKT